MSNLCCISVSIGARLIGALGLSLSILMVNVLIGDYLGRVNDTEFLIKLESWALLGLNWTQFIRNTEISKDAKIMLICFISYSLVFLITSGLLALGTIFRKPNYALPWLYFQLINIADQMISLTVHWTRATGYNTMNKSNWYIQISSVYLFISVYFWMVVFAARENWINCPNNNHETNVLSSIIPCDHNSDCNVRKTPSFLAQNQFFHEPHVPPIEPIKYNIV